MIHNSQTVKPFRYSTISDFHKCNQYYHLKHILGHEDDTGSSADIAFGSAIHAAMQDLFEDGDGHDVLDAFWGIQKDKGLNYTRLRHDDLHSIGHALLDIFVSEHKKKFVTLLDKEAQPLIERKMLGKVGRHAFGGTADFIGEYKGVPSLVDWKTAAYPYDQYKLIYNEQLYGYVELAQQTLGLTLKQGVYAVAVKDPQNPRWQFKTTDITSEKLASVVDNITLVCDDLSRRKAFPKNPSQCVVGKRVCPFFNKCYGVKNE